MVLAKERHQRLQNLCADFIFIFFLQLKLQGGIISSFGRCVRAVRISKRVADGHRINFQPLNSVGNQIANGRSLLPAQLCRAVHRHGHSCRSFHHIAAIQYIAMVLTRRNINRGVLYIFKSPDGVAHTLLEEHQIRIVPFRFCRKRTHMVVICRIGISGLRIARHQNTPF